MTSEGEEQFVDALDERPTLYFRRLDKRRWGRIPEDDVCQYDSKDIGSAKSGREFRDQLNALAGSVIWMYDTYQETIYRYNDGSFEVSDKQKQYHSDIALAVRNCVQNQRVCEVYSYNRHSDSETDPYKEIRELVPDTITAVDTPDGLVFAWLSSASQNVRLYPNLKEAKRCCRVNRQKANGTPKPESRLQSANAGLKNALFNALWKAPHMAPLVKEWAGAGRTYDSNFKHYLTQINFILWAKGKRWLLHKARKSMQAMLEVMDTIHRKPQGENFEPLRVQLTKLLKQNKKAKPVTQTATTVHSSNEQPVAS